MNLKNNKKWLAAIIGLVVGLAVSAFLALKGAPEWFWFKKPSVDEINYYSLLNLVVIGVSALIGWAIGYYLDSSSEGQEEEAEI